MTVTPFGQTFLVDALVNGADVGDGAGTAQIFGPGGTTFTYGSPSRFSNSTTYASPITSLGVNLSLMLSAGASATFSGKVSVTPNAATPAPEPSSVAAFLFTGLGAAALILRARKRRA